MCSDEQGEATGHVVHRHSNIDICHLNELAWPVPRPKFYFGIPATRYDNTLAILQLDADNLLYRCGMFTNRPDLVRV
jgi:hypothetical protein